MMTLLCRNCASIGASVLLCRAVPTADGSASPPVPGSSVATGAEVCFGAYLSTAPAITNKYYGDASCYVFILGNNEQQVCGGSLPCFFERYAKHLMPPSQTHDVGLRVSLVVSVRGRAQMLW